jgi:ferric-chelate reductase
MSATINAPTSGPLPPPFPNNPYRGYQLWQREEYPKQVWAFVGASIGALVLCNIVYILRVRSRKSKLMKKFQAKKVSNDNERSVTADGPTSSWQRLLLATEAGFKIVAFRFMVPYGLTEVLSLSEIFFTVGYLTMIMIWNFIYSELLLKKREPC